MKPSFLLATTFICLSFIASPLLADRNTESKLLKDLRPLVEKARKQRAADRWLLRDLEDLLARYDNPWRREALFDDFRDGDYTHNPRWQVMQGEFEVLRRQGLYSDARGRKGRRSDNAGDREMTPEEMISGMLMESMLGKQENSRNHDERRHRSRTAEIRVNADISNAFAIDMEFRLGRRQSNDLELILMQSNKARYGYRLRLATGKKGFVEMLRVRKGRTKVVQTADLGMSLNDGQTHDLSWRLARDGNVSVLIDDKELFLVRTRMLRDGFPWLQLNNNRGELVVRSIRISGA